MRRVVLQRVMWSKLAGIAARAFRALAATLLVVALVVAVRRLYQLAQGRSRRADKYA
jgi:hypothetical protein